MKYVPLNPHLPPLWDKAGYPSGMGSARVTQPPEAKYVRVYHITSAKHAISNIENKRIKVARIADLNDPFELIAVDFREIPVRRTAKEYKNKMNGRIGIVCFSSNWTEPVLWSHYGKKHEGICLGFDLDRSIAEEVIYESSRLLQESDDQTEIYDPTILSDHLQKLLLKTKYEHWAYESERRIFVNYDECDEQDGLYFLPFNEKLRLTEVIVGPMCKSTLDRVKGIVSGSYNDVVTIQARLAWKHFRVVPKESTVTQLKS